MPRQEEYENQCAIFNWAEWTSITYPELELLSASLNGVRLTVGQATKAKRSGMKKGWPDIELPVARGGYFGLFIELKVGYNKPSDEQLKILSALAKEGYLCHVIWGAGAAIKEIERYLNLPKTEVKKNNE